MEGVGEDYQGKASATELGTSHHLSYDIPGGTNYGDYGCLNIFATICDIYGDVWKVHQTNVTNPPENGGGLASLEITLYDSQQNTLHIAKHTPLLSVPHGTHTLLQGVPGGMGNCHMLPGHTIDVTRCACHECGKVRLSGHTIDVTRCDSPRGDKVHLGHVYCGGTLQLGLQSSRSRPRGWK